ncbi:hypothetical protein MKK55_06110 [Methylobacterium sp. J-059]|uniref:hypothetical protein n=1 Tax=Methylobacterium sp. J-059 TaxID=2836643 RepID=UPI001FBB1448|nr:hypothetical protein [Methylobacterium sp. J-059]MCJ2038533.1 hypothetical protein [Methylobacterium sp. J-059]
MKRHGFSIFCDDIRNEVGGKLSFIGCYNSVMFASPDMPFILPKFCIHTHVISSAEHPLSSVLLRCYVPGLEDPIIEEPVETPPIAEQRKLVSALESGSTAPRYIVASASLILSPFEILSTGLISVRAVLGDMAEELSLGALRVVVAD